VGAPTTPDSTSDSDDDGGFWGGVGDFFSGAGSFLWGTGKGIVGGAWDTVTGIASLGWSAVKGVWWVVTNPVEAAQGVWHAVTHPVETATAAWNFGSAVASGIWTALGNAWETVKHGSWEERGNIFGRAGFEVALTVGTGGAGHAMKARWLGKVDDVTDVARIAENVDDVSDAARIAGLDDVGAAARIAENADDAADVARVLARISEKPPNAPLTLREADVYMEHVVVPKVAGFFRPGVGYDARTGMALDGRHLDAVTGALADARRLSAASKESLHLTVLAKALQGDRTAMRLLSPDDPARARQIALDVLERKIATLEDFHQTYPGYGGFLPWYGIDDGRIFPLEGWGHRTPSLDNGQMAWSLYHTTKVLEESGEVALAARYGDYLGVMKQNVVRVFFDADAGHLYTEARIHRGIHVPVADNFYSANAPVHYLNDPYEGLMMVHFADAFGHWPSGAMRNAPWREPRRIPRDVAIDGREFTIVRGESGSSHEAWAYMFLPTTDHAVARRLYQNEQQMRTAHAANRGSSGLAAAAHALDDEGNVVYRVLLGIDEAGRVPSESRSIFTPYGAFPLASVDRAGYATWLRNTLSNRGMLTPHGMADSFDDVTGAVAPVVTFDVNGLTMVSWMGGTTDDMRRFMKADGIYDDFMGRVRDDYRLFDDAAVTGGAGGLTPPPRAGPGAGGTP
jgi:hypothetical protein